MSIGLKVTVFLVGCNGNWKKRNSTCALIDPTEKCNGLYLIPADYNVMLRLMSCERNWTCFACLKSILATNQFGPVVSK